MNGEIDVVLGPTDSVAVTENPIAPGTVQILINGTPAAAFPIVSASAVAKVSITGGDDANLIDLTGITSAVFNNPALSIEAHGGNGADTLLGSDSLADSLNGGHGADSIVGNGGNDALLGDDGNDTINGGTGDDNIDAGDGQDVVDGNDGNDTIIAGDGQDSVTGSAGNDSVSGGDGVDTLLGGDGIDILNGEAGSDSLDGQNGDDSIFGGSGNDTLLGGSGADSVDGQSGNDLVFADAVTGQVAAISNDTLLGGNGNDTLNGADGNDVINGQAGDDLVIGHDGNDSILGGSGNDALFGDGNDPLQIGTGNDTLFGNAGNDSLVGGGGGDVMDGGAGNDVVKSGDFDSINSILINALDSPSVLEGNFGVSGNAVFTVTLSQVPITPVTVTYTTANGSATAGLDYTATAGVLTFNPGVTSLTVSVPVLSDTISESTENFFLNLTATVGGFILDSQAQALILDNDGWAPLGPAPATNGQTENVSPNDEVVGAVHVIAPNPLNPNIMFIGGVNGGIWRTTNAQAASPTWTPVTDQAASLSIGAIAFDPANLNSMVAGIARHSSLGFDGGSLTGLLRSTDGGLTWTSPSNALTGQNVAGIAIRGNTILASADPFFSAGGLFRSTDGGVTFTNIAGTNGLAGAGVSDLVDDPTNPNRFYVTSYARGVFRSDDLGATWINVSVNDGTLNSNITSQLYSNAEMAVGQDGRIFVGVITNGELSYIGYSSNQGLTWTAMDLPETLEAGGTIVGLQPEEDPAEENPFDTRPLNTLDPQVAGGQGQIHFSMAVDPTNSNVVYLGGDRQDVPFPNSIGAQNFSGRLFRGDTSITGNGGAPSPQWAHLTHIPTSSTPNGGTANGSSPHADSRDMAFDAAGNLIEGDDGGVYRRTSPRTNTGDWFSIIGNMQISEQHDVAWDTNANIALSGNQDTGSMQESATGSLTWNEITQGDGGDVAVDTLAIPGQSIRYASSQFLGGFQGNIYNAANALQNTFFPALNVAGGGFLIGQFDTPIRTNAVAGDRLLIGDGNGLFESGNRGNNLVNIAPNILVNQFAQAMAYGGTRQGAANPNVIYVGDGRQIFVRLAGNGAPLRAASYPGGTVTGITLDPRDFQIAYVTDNNSVWRTTDGGTTWTSVTGNLNDQLRSVAFVPGRNGTPDVVVVGANLGVYRMAVAMPGQWRELGSTLPNVPVSEIVYDNSDDLLVVGTLGRGTWNFINASQGDQPSILAVGIPPNTFVSIGDTMFGGDGSDLIQGADGNDVINAEGGNDTVLGGLGDDSILGGSGADLLDGQAGNDTLAGQGGKDTLIGGEGDDTFQWNAITDGDDVVSSVDGFDQMQITATNGADTVSIGKLGPRIQVTSGANVLTINAEIHVVTIDLGNGNDVVTVGDLLGVSQTVLTINGGDGNDTLDASAGVLGDVRLRLNGDAGNDRIVGSANDDTIDGGAGKDTLFGGNGNDTIFGGADNDAINGGAGDDSMTGDDGNDTLAGGDGNDTLLGGLGNDSLTAQAGNDSLDGAEGRDTLLGGDGNDSLDAGGGKDYLAGGEGNDTLDGGRNDDTILGEAGADTIRGNHGNDSIDAGTGDDTVSGGDGNDVITGGDGNDLMTGADGNDVLNGGAGNDTLTGSDGNDLLAGGGGNDVVLCDDGDDTVNGNGGSNTLAGGQGNDSIIGATSEINENFVLSADLLKKLDLL